MNDQRGAALPMAILVVLVLTVLSGIMINALSNEIRFRTVTEERVIARYLTEAGFEHLMYLRKYDDDFAPGSFTTPGQEAIAPENVSDIGNYTVIFVEAKSNGEDEVFKVSGTLSSTGRSMTLTVVLKENTPVQVQESFN